jgi:hypothetical protein
LDEIWNGVCLLYQPRRRQLNMTTCPVRRGLEPPLLITALTPLLLAQLGQSIPCCKPTGKRRQSGNLAYNVGENCFCAPCNDVAGLVYSTQLAPAATRVPTYVDQMASVTTAMTHRSGEKVALTLPDSILRASNFSSMVHTCWSPCRNYKLDSVGFSKPINFNR